ncbi:MAG: V-type ATP synthase subunit E family protein [Candidatus Bathyarchaeia archaeon]
MDRTVTKAIGGAIISIADQKASVDNTFEARLGKIREEEKAELETILFK